MPVEIRELVINASLRESAREGGEQNSLLQESDREELNERIKSLEKKIRMQSKTLEQKIVRECLAEVRDLIAEQERNLR